MKPPRDMPPVFFSLEATVRMLSRVSDELIAAHNKLNTVVESTILICSGVAKLFDLLQEKGILTHEEIKIAISTSAPQHSVLDLLLGAPDRSTESPVLPDSSDAGIEGGCSPKEGEPDESHLLTDSSLGDA